MQPVCLQCTGHLNPQLVLWFKMIGMHREEWGGWGWKWKEVWQGIVGEKREHIPNAHCSTFYTAPSLPPHHRPLYFCPLHIPPIASQYSCQFAAPGEDKDGNPHSSVLLWKTETEERCTTERIRKKQVSCNWKRRKASTTWPQMCKFRKRQLHKSKERMTQT